MVKHTPGPWEVRTVDGSIGSIDAVCGIQVAQAQEISVLDRNTGHHQRLANTRLIAAAPELLEALTAFVRNPGLTETERQQLAITAFTKATGEAP